MTTDIRSRLPRDQQAKISRCANGATYGRCSCERCALSGSSSPRTHGVGASYWEQLSSLPSPSCSAMPPTDAPLIPCHLAKTKNPMASSARLELFTAKSTKTGPAPQTLQETKPGHEALLGTDQLGSRT